jgi:hypothetical protein
MTGDAGPLQFDEVLAELADTMWGITERIGDPHSALQVADAADHVHSIVSAAADVLGALSHWYERHADDLFDENVGAEGDAQAVAREAGGALRALGAQLREDAGSSTEALAGLRRFGNRALYELDEDELDDEDEAYAVCEVDFAGGRETDVKLYARLDVARHAAREVARGGQPGNVFRVVPIIGGERERHVAEWPGKGEGDA